jgi:hypothetical protein
MSIRCFLGCHDYEPFGDGVPLLSIFERSARIKADALYIPEFKNEIYDFLKNNIKSFFDLTEFRIIKDEVCLRCGTIKSNIQTYRTIADRRAVFAGMAIILREDRQVRAKKMLKFMEK